MHQHHPSTARRKGKFPLVVFIPDIFPKPPWICAVLLLPEASPGPSASSTSLPWNSSSAPNSPSAVLTTFSSLFLLAPYPLHPLLFLTSYPSHSKFYPLPWQRNSRKTTAPYHHVTHSWICYFFGCVISLHYKLFDKRITCWSPVPLLHWLCTNSCFPGINIIWYLQAVSSMAFQPDLQLQNYSHKMQLFFSPSTTSTKFCFKSL